MSSLEQLRCDPGHPIAAAGALLAALGRGNWVRLLGPQDVPLEAPKALPEGPGLVLSTGGSSGGRQLCLQPSIHLDRSAAATGRWFLCLLIHNVRPSFTLPLKMGVNVVVLKR